jgi:hypothetical protein
VAAVRGLVGPSAQVDPEVRRLFARLQRLFFLAEGQTMSA